MFSKACEYAIKATLQIAQQSQVGKRSSLKDIAKAIDSPEAFTAKILQQLARQGLIFSVKGPNGGFELNQDDANNLMLSQIVKAIDGDQIYIGCGLGLKQCNEFKPCPVHDKFKAIRDSLSDMLENTSVNELANGLNKGLTFLRT